MVFILPCSQKVEVLTHLQKTCTGYTIKILEFEANIQTHSRYFKSNLKFKITPIILCSLCINSYSAALLIENCEEHTIYILTENREKIQYWAVNRHTRWNLRAAWRLFPYFAFHRKKMIINVEHDTVESHLQSKTTHMDEL